MGFEKRLRLFAGPNGSGKSTVITGIVKSGYDCGVYLNADILEREMNDMSCINLQSYKLDNITNEEFDLFLDHHSLCEKAQDNGYNMNLKCNNGIITNKNKGANSYEASIMISFIVSKLLEKSKKFSFESVMSHESKIEILRVAKAMGYKNYLYYVCTEDVMINLARVEARVKKGGHPVKKEKIISRYTRSLDLLSEAIKHSYRSYIFDNSGTESQLILEIDSTKEADNTIVKSEIIPNWIKTYVIDKLS